MGDSLYHYKRLFRILVLLSAKIHFAYKAISYNLYFLVQYGHT